MSPVVSVIVLSLDRREELAECLHSVYAQDYSPFEVIVLDNGSRDGSVEMVRHDFPFVKLIVLERNVGACAGRNRALEAASGQFIFQIDNDATVTPDSMRTMVERFLAEDDLGIIFTRIIDPATGRAYRPGYGSRHIEREFYTWRFHGCAAMIRRSAIEAAGYYLPEDFFRAAEENDLAVRTLDAGFNILYMPAAVAYHRLSPKSRNRGKIVYLTVRNNLAVAWKYYRLPRAALLTLWRVPHFVMSRLMRGDLSAAGRVPGILAGVKRALKLRRPVSRATLRLIDALTMAPAMTVHEMRRLRKSPPAVGIIRLAGRRLTRAAQ